MDYMSWNSEAVAAAVAAILDDDGTKTCEYCGEDCTDDYIELGAGRYLCRKCYHD